LVDAIEIEPMSPDNSDDPTRPSNCIERRCASIEPGNWRIGNTLRWRGHCLAKLQRNAEAERDLLAGLDILSAALGPEHWRVERLQQQLDQFYATWGRTGQGSCGGVVRNRSPRRPS